MTKLSHGSKVANTHDYNREARKINQNLSKLVKEVGLIEENKFTDQHKASHSITDPTQEFF